MPNLKYCSLCKGEQFSRFQETSKECPQCSGTGHHLPKRRKPMTYPLEVCPSCWKEDCQCEEVLPEGVVREGKRLIYTAKFWELFSLELEERLGDKDEPST